MMNRCTVLSALAIPAAAAFGPIAQRAAGQALYSPVFVVATQDNSKGAPTTTTFEIRPDGSGKQNLPGTSSLHVADLSRVRFGGLRFFLGASQRADSSNDLRCWDETGGGAAPERRHEQQVLRCGQPGLSGLVSARQ